MSHGVIVLVFDLDPDDSEPFRAAMEGARPCLETLPGMMRLGAHVAIEESADEIMNLCRAQRERGQ